jgi:hypothetical protein
MSSRLNSREQREFAAYVEALLAGGGSDEVFASIGALDVPPPFRVRVKVLYSSHTPVQTLESALSNGDLSRLSEVARAFAYELPKHGHSSGKSRVRRVPFFIASLGDSEISSHVQAMISICTSDHWRALRSFVKDLYPRLVPILLSQSELIRCTKLLVGLSQDEVRVTSFSGKERLRNTPGKGRKSVREWTDEILDQALLSIQNRGQIISVLDVEFYPTVNGLPHVRPRASCKIRKDGEVEVVGGFEVVFRSVVRQIAAAGDRKLGFLRGRGLREAQYKPNPLAITFARRVFEDVTAIRSLVQVLAKYPRSMYAIAHGNPYAHVVLTDLCDGSSFDVWALPPDKVSIVPGLKASEAAFERIVDYIFRSFREGELVNYE